MDSTKEIGMDVHKQATTLAVLYASGKLVMESIVETSGHLQGRAVGYLS